MLWGQASFDSSGGYGFEDTEYIYTRRYTHTQGQRFLSARFIAHLSGTFSSGRKSFVELLFSHIAAFGQTYEKNY